MEMLVPALTSCPPGALRPQNPLPARQGKQLLPFPSSRSCPFAPQPFPAHGGRCNFGKCAAVPARPWELRVWGICGLPVGVCTAWLVALQLLQTQPGAVLVPPGPQAGALQWGDPRQGQ